MEESGQVLDVETLVPLTMQSTRVTPDDTIANQTVNATANLLDAPLDTQG